MGTREHLSPSTSQCSSAMAQSLLWKEVISLCLAVYDRSRVKSVFELMYSFIIQTAAFQVGDKILDQDILMVLLRGSLTWSTG